MSKGTVRFPESAIADGRVGTARIREEISGAAANLASATPAVLGEPIRRLLVAGTPASKAEQPKRRSKYGNRQTVVDGITFDSQREADRYCALVLRQKAGEICNLRLQVPFVVVKATTIHGKSVRERFYIADFVYDMPHGLMVVEDAKGMQTPMYRIKRQLMKVVHNIEIQEI
jgi:hypothetical protein